MKRCAVAILAVCLVASFGASAAMAGPRATPVRVAEGASSYGGYLFVTTHVQQVSALLTVPTLACGSEDTFASFSIALGTASHHQAARVGVDATCAGGSPRYAGWVKDPGSTRQGFGRTIKVGDVMRLRLVSLGPSAELSDQTRGWGVGMSGTTALAATVAGVGSFRQADGSLPLSNFGHIAFSNVRLDKRPVDGQTVLRILMQTAQLVVQAKPSRLTKAGDFIVRWLHG